MKYLKMLGLAAIAAAALTAFLGAGTASANTVLCHQTVTSSCAEDWDKGDALDFSLKSGTTARLTDTTSFITIETCTGSTINGTLSSTTTPKGTVIPQNLTWSGCLETTETLTEGELEIHHITGTHNGTLTGSGFAVTTEWNSGTETCSYGLGAGKDLGTIVPSEDGRDAQISINVVVDLVAAHSDSGCPSSGRWIATYTQTTATNLYVSAS